MTDSFTAQVMRARADYLTTGGPLGEATATVQTCIALWEGGFALADVDGTALLDRATMALAARSLALRGEAVFLVRGEGLVPAVSWDVVTRRGAPSAYRLDLADVTRTESVRALAAEVLHVRTGADPAAPWAGVPPLRRAALTGAMLEEVEGAVLEIYRNAPLASQIVPYPETEGVDLETMGHGFRGRRGNVLMRESTQVTAAGGAAPHTDWKPLDVTPNIEGALPVPLLDASRNAIFAAFGVLPAMHDRIAQGPVVREAQRHLAQWTLQPLAALLAEEASRKLGDPVSIDLMRPLQAYDVGARARALKAILEGMAAGKEMGLSEAQVEAALTRVNWGAEDVAA